MPAFIGTRRAPIMGGRKRILDQVPNAAAAFSARKIRAAYTGPAIRVRRSSDNAEADIGFAGNDLDIAALSAHCGAGSGFVSVWYDQSGNGRNVVQTNTALQPTLVSSGVVNTQNSRPSLPFNGSKYLLNTAFAGAMPNAEATFAMVVNVDPDTAAFSRLLTLYKTGDTNDFNASTSYQFLGLNNGITNLTTYHSAVWNGASSNTLFQISSPCAGGVGNNKIYTNTVFRAQNSTTRVLSMITTDNLIVGAGASSSSGLGVGAFRGHVSELILFTTSLSDTNRLIVGSNQCQYHNIAMT